MSLDSRSFSESFVVLTGHSPMRWQHRLFNRLVAGKIPAALDLPTGLGKTSVMAIWLVARALAQESALNAIPRRLVYVVDRRAVVDQATEEAEKLRKAIDGQAEHFAALDEGRRTQARHTAAELKERLGFESARRLPISTLRGAYVASREWLDDPAAPAIIVGTVDMIGSRLLFEGYGVSRKMRPYQAGLLGADTLVVLDEAHLVPPFEAMLRSVVEQGLEFGPCIGDGRDIVPPFKLLSLSATGRSRPVADGGVANTPFRLEGEDLSDPVVKQRLAAKKSLGFVPIAAEKGALAEALVQQAWRLSGEGSSPVRCLLYCNSREIAETVTEKLDKLASSGRKATVARADTELFVGARRVKERELARRWLQDHGFLAGSAAPSKPSFLIATSAGEVGVDLDADHMVCDLVPWERMVQRLGRVNRRGESAATIIVVHSDEPKPKKPDAPTEPEERQTTGYNSLAVLRMLPDVDGGRDASPGAVRDLKLRAETDQAWRVKIDQATTPEPLHPALSRALVDAWSMTSLEHHTGRPEVAPWLRGWVEEEPQTTIIWRTYLPLSIADDGRMAMPSKKAIEAFFEAAPPHESEKLETETHRAVGFVQGRARTLLERGWDVPEKRADVDDDALATGDDIETAEAGAPPTVPQIKELRREDIVAFAFSPDGGHTARYTLGELAQERKGRAKDEFHDELIGKMLIMDTRFGGLANGLLKYESDADFPTADASDAWSEEAGFRVRRATPENYASKEEDWRFEDDLILRTDGNGDPTEWLVVEHYQNAAQSEEGRSVSKPQELGEHQSWAAQKAREIAAKIGLSGAPAEALALAAFLHDEGKRAQRWQRAFKARRDAERCGLTGPLAKTRGPIDQAILDGYRHELGSLPYVEQNAEFKDLPDDWRELVLHLVAAHHGQARPVIETRGCEDGPPSLLEERARDVALRFARLQKRWGPWGLAWWEALLRAADQQASRDNDMREEAPHAEKI